MKKIIPILIILAVACSFSSSSQDNAEPWKPGQIMAPQVLDSILKSAPGEKPLVICIGPSALIKGSVDAGAAKDKVNLDKLRQLLLKEKKDREIVIYCGCCPFDRCPNIRPAFRLLNEMKFTHQKLLNLPKNLKTDWIDKGYPVSQ